MRRTVSQAGGRQASSFFEKKKQQTFLPLDPSGGDAGASAFTPANGQKFFWFFFFKKRTASFLPLAFLFFGFSRGRLIEERGFLASGR
jgi:hypothetical protein